MTITRPVELGKMQSILSVVCRRRYIRRHKTVIDMSVMTKKSAAFRLALPTSAPPTFANRQKRGLPLAHKAADVVLADGKIVDKTKPARSVTIADGRRERILHETTNKFDSSGSHASNTHSAVFAEVKVDEELGVTRVVNAVAAGRILNPKTARSQIMGSVVGASAWRCTRKR